MTRQFLATIKPFPILPALLLVGLFVVMAAFSFTPFAGADSKNVSRSGRHILTVHDGEREIGIMTEKETLQAALDEAGIVLDKNDITEPKRDEKLVSGQYEVNIYRARPVMVVDGELKTRIMSAYRTPRQIAEHAGLKLNDQDQAELGLSEDIIKDGASEIMTIKRATPFTLIFYGKTTQSYTQAKTVGEMLKEKDITLGEQDGMSVESSTTIQAGMTVHIWRNGKQTLTEEQEIAFPVEKINDANQPIGFREVQTPGVAGKKTVTYEIEMRDGQEVSRREVNSITNKEPVKQVEIVGSKNNYSGTLNEWLLALRTCETHGNYQAATGNGYYGAYQFLPSTWNSIAKRTGRADLVGVLPSNAAPADQDAMVIANTKATAGLSTQHPGCYRKLGLSNYPPN